MLDVKFELMNRKIFVLFCFAFYSTATLRIATGVQADKAKHHLKKMAK